jgi:hypothetical protein
VCTVPFSARVQLKGCLLVHTQPCTCEHASRGANCAVSRMACCCRGKAGCSYTCTPDGVRQLTTVTGTTDRWAEAIIEASYGRLSMLADPVVLPTLYLPQTLQAGDNAFSYSGSLVQPYLQSLGYDLFRDFHTVIVSACTAAATQCRSAQHFVTRLKTRVAAARPQQGGRRT